MPTFVRIAAALALLPLAAVVAQQTSTPPGGSPLPWMAVSIHPTDPAHANDPNEHEQPNGISQHALTVKELISQAYNFSVFSFRDDEIDGLPAWAKSAKFDVQARVDPDDVATFRKLSGLSTEETVAAFTARQSTGEMLMEQALLAERFHLKAHWESKERSVYLLTVAKDGVRMSAAADPKHGTMDFSEGKLSGKGVPVSFLASLLALPAERTVMDRTNLPGEYDFELHFAPRELTAPEKTNDPDFFRAVQEQLGLKLESSKAQVPVLVIDHIDQPTPN